MIKSRYIFYMAMAGLLLMAISKIPSVGIAQDKTSEICPPVDVHIKLTREFYEALRGKDRQGTRIYRNDPSIEYLRQISISSRFMVETNLQILKQQERIIRLLQSDTEKKNR